MLLGVTEVMRIADEEIFGPVIAVYPPDNVDEPIEAINARPALFAAHRYGTDSPDFRRLLNSCAPGGITRNDMALHCGIGRMSVPPYSPEARQEALDKVRAAVRLTRDRTRF